MAALAEPELDSAQAEKSFGYKSSLPERKPVSAWSDDGLEDDIATLSYERALKTHARYRATDQLPAQLYEAEIEPAPTESVVAVGAKHSFTAPPEPNALGVRRAFARNLKDASITIRMSKAECAQLQTRAAEAGLSVSAYLRSCTVEAESLRAMVKETLEQLRAAKTEAEPVPLRRSWLSRWSDWLGRILTPWHGSQRAARA
jgi:hypothetical protein